MKLSENQTLEQILESAVLASWKDLTNGARPELIHIEYNFAAGGTLDDLRIWSSITRGRWLLICEYRMSPANSHSSGIRFENGYHSELLASTLEWVMQNQRTLALPANLSRPGLLQIPRPTEAEMAAAAASVTAICDGFNSAHIQPALS
ncbi:MAG TPA: hypothetical protein VFA90_09980 [Terriglobales bacterium]|nr:hypothetical protein [Terriglobales bacterium]